VTRASTPACTSDLACFRNDGHAGDHAYATPDTGPQPVADRPEGTIRRKVWFSETLALGLGASLLTWGEPDDDGFYTPTLTRAIPAPLDDWLARVNQARNDRDWKALNDLVLESQPVTLAATPAPLDGLPTTAGNRMAAWLGSMIWRIPGTNDLQRRAAQEVGNDFIAAIEAGAPAPLDPLVAALTDEDEIAHGEAWSETKGGLGVCAYCDEAWPCRTQRGIDKALTALREVIERWERKEETV